MERQVKKMSTSSENRMAEGEGTNAVLKSLTRHLTSGHSRCKEKISFLKRVEVADLFLQLFQGEKVAAVPASLSKMR